MVLLTAQGLAQEPSETAPEENTLIEDSSGLKQAFAVRVEEAPVIDGFLDDEAWDLAVPIDDFLQIDPVLDAEPYQRTEVRILFDSKTLYISAFLAYDNPDEITAQIMVPVQRIARDDRFSFILDPFFDRRNGYYFEVNANAIQGDALIENNSRLLADWDGIWRAESQISDDGWRVEIAIPFSTVAFNPNSDRWGINFFREFRVRQESLAWSSQGRQRFQVAPAFAGELLGLSGLNQGLGLDLVPSATIQSTRDFTTSEEDTTFEPSLDVTYRLTPSMTARLTLNTDFAATEVDSRQVNLSRFSLFFPEKREFFLQDAGIFEFARLGGNGRPFFSRTIGLTPDNEPLNLNVGAKLTGRQGEWNMGFLGVQQEESENLDAQNAFVARVTRNLFSGSSIGIIATDGDPQNERDAQTFGADFRYRTDAFLGDKVLEGEAWIQGTNNDPVPGEEPVSGGDGAWGVRLEYPDDRHRVSGRYYVYEDNFDPAMGFVNRNGIDESQLYYRFRHRPGSGPVLRYDHDIRWRNIRSTVNEELSQSLRVSLVELETTQSDQWQLFAEQNRERLVEGFDLVDRLYVPPGDYKYFRYGLDFTPASYRVWELGFRIAFGDFLDGTRTDWRVRGEWKPSPHFRMRAEYVVNDLKQTSGAFTAKIVSLRTEIAFTPRLSFVPLVQFDNVSDEMGINARLRWQPVRGQDLFFVWNRSMIRLDDESFASTRQDTVLKGIYTFRF